ncbi:MAG: hypothetical protein IKW52_05465 [Alistipes sp.]|nr:hypothetical protein [Alistipes sp.]
MRELFAIIIALMLMCCNRQSVEQALPTATIDIVTIDDNAVEATVSTANAEIAAWICEELRSAPPTATHILSKGHDIEPNGNVAIRAEELSPNTEYILAVAAFNDTTSGLAIVEFTTLDAQHDETDSSDNSGNEREETEESEESENDKDDKDDDNQDDSDKDDDVEAEVLDLAFAYASTFKGSETSSGCNIALKDKDMSYSLAVSFTGLPYNRLIAGSYRIGAEQVESNIAMTLSTPTGDIVASSGEVTVQRDHEQYTLNIEFCSERVLLSGRYCGAIAGLNIYDDEPEGDESGSEEDNKESDTTLTHGTIHKELVSRYWELTLSNDDKSTMLYAEIYGYDIDLGYLVPGKYSVKSSGVDFAEGDIDYYYSKLTMDKRSEQLRSGILDVALNGDTYTIKIDITDAAGRKFESTFEGEIVVK